MNWLTSRCAPLVAFAALALASCDKGTDLNVDLPDTSALSTEYVEYKSPLLNVATVQMAPVQTLKSDHFMVGRVADNVAGTTEAKAYFNVVDASGLIAIGAGTNDTLPATFAAASLTPLLDSVVLVAGFDKVYGSASTPVKFDVYKLAAPLDDRQVYDSGTNTPLAAGDVLGQNLTSRLDRTQVSIVTAAVVATTTTPAIPAVTTIIADPTVRLVLQRTAVAAGPGQPALPGVASPFSTSLFTQLLVAGFGQTQLDAMLKGLAIVPSANHNSSIVNFSKAYKSRIVVYYHTGVQLAVQSHSYSIYFGPAFSALSLTSSRDPRYYTQISNTFPTALAPLAVRTGAVDFSALGGTSYIQEGIGLGTRLTFTGLTDLIKAAQAGGLTINRAELRVPVKPFTNALFPSPSFLYALEVNANNEVLQRTINYAPTDRVVQADGTDPLGASNVAIGNLTNASSTSAYYTIPITTYLQAYLTNKLEGNPTSLVLVPNIRNSATLSLNRAALDASQISLRVYYSKK